MSGIPDINYQNIDRGTVEDDRAYLEGYNSYTEGQAKRSNPFNDTRSFTQWNRGWHSAEWDNINE